MIELEDIATKKIDFVYLFNEEMPFFRLVSLHGSLKKLLPEDYSQFEKMENPGDVQREPIRPFKRSSMEFNGVQVKLKLFLKNIPDILKLIKVHKFARFNFWFLLIDLKSSAFFKLEVHLRSHFSVSVICFLLQFVVKS
jgi:hypothetical protein